jgi:hypothetical protein
MGSDNSNSSDRSSEKLRDDSDRSRNDSSEGRH